MYNPSRIGNLLICIILLLGASTILIVSSSLQLDASNLRYNSVTGTTGTVGMESQVGVTGNFWNDGTTQTPTFTVAIYLSSDSTITTSDTKLDEYWYGYMEGGTSDSIYLTAFLPAGVSGTYYLGFYLDIYNEVSETSENDNGQAVASTIYIQPPPMYPDITPTSISAGSSATLGGSLSVSFTWSNIGTGSISVSDTWFYDIGLFHSTTLAKITSLGQASFTGNYGSGYNSPTITASWSIPTSINPGTYKIGIQMDYYEGISGLTNLITESNENNNIRHTSSSVSITSPYEIAAATLAYSGSPAEAGQSITVTPYVQNSGTAILSNVVVNFYLSTDTVITTSDLFIGTRSITSIAVSSTFSQAYSLQVPVSTTPGNYRVGMIVDPNNDIVENNENNNAQYGTGFLSVTSPYDAKAYDITVVGSTHNAGDVTNISPYIQNLGSVTLSGVVYRIYLSPDTTITSSDIYIGQGTTGNIAPGNTWSTPWGITFPITLASGTYYLGLIVDPSNSLGESDETNNIIASSSITINAVADLNPTSLSRGPDSTYSPGQSVTISASISNAGSLPSGEFQVTIYLSTDTTITTGDTLLNTVSVASLTTSTTISIVVNLPYISGTFYFGIIVDSGGVVSEVDETNNVRASSSVNIGWDDGNQDFASADQIGLGHFSGDVNASIDVYDYLSFDLTTGQILNITGTVTGSVYVYLYNPSETALLIDTNGGSFILVTAAATTGTYYVTFRLAGGTTGTYDATLIVTDPLPDPDNNDDHTNAENISEGTYGGNLHPDDEVDYFTFHVEDGNVISISYSLSEVGYLDLTLENFDGVILASTSITSGLTGELTFYVTQDNEYYVRFSLNAPTVLFTYSFNLEIIEDPNGRFDRGTPVNSGTFSDDLTYPGDLIDNFAVSVLSGYIITISITANNDVDLSYAIGSPDRYGICTCTAYTFSYEFESAGEIVFRFYSPNGLDISYSFTITIEQIVETTIVETTIVETSTITTSSSSSTTTSSSSSTTSSMTSSQTSTQSTQTSDETTIDITDDLQVPGSSIFTVLLVMVSMAGVGIQRKKY